MVLSTLAMLTEHCPFRQSYNNQHILAQVNKELHMLSMCWQPDTANHKTIFSSNSLNGGWGPCVILT